MKYPFDPSIRNHVLLALGLGIWIFIFLYFTEPLDVNELSNKEKLTYLPVYGLFGSICYLLTLPLQGRLIEKTEPLWVLKKELLFLGVFIVITFIAMRSFYLFVIMDGIPNPYTLSYYTFHIFFPAFLTLFPVVIIGRWGLGKYKEKQYKENKIEIKGAGNYENLRITWSSLLFIQSSDNYIEVTYFEKDDVRKSLIRAKLTEVEKSIPQLLRTHRSFLINPEHFRKWKNHKGRMLIEIANEIEIPVSKTFQDSVKKQLNFTPK